MKRMVLFFLFSAMLMTYSQENWYWQNPSLTGTELTKVDFVNENVGWFIGYNCTLMKTTNGGKSWNKQNFIIQNPHEYSLKDLDFIDENNGFVVGDGFILRTSDGGKNWINQMDVWGNGWETVVFIDSNNAYAGGWNGLAKTTNGGINWDIILNEISFNDLWCFDLNTIYALYSGGLFKTTNAGLDWITLNVNGGSLENIFFVDESNGFIASDVGFGEGEIYRTTDGGITWNFNQINDLVEISFRNKFNGFAMGDYILYETTDGGLNWNFKEYLSKVKCMCFLNDNLAYSVGKVGYIAKTTNGGNDWIELTNRADAGDLYDIAFSDRYNGVAVGEDIIKTTNCGITWKLIPNIADNFLKSVSLKNNYGMAVGYSGIILHTTNGGETWIQQNSGTGVDLLSVSLSNENNAIIVGESPSMNSGTILRTTNGGITWISQTIQHRLHSILMIDSLNGFITAEYYILKTTNGGEDWDTSYFLENGIYYDISFADLNNGMVVGVERQSSGSDSGVVLKTTNRGTSWSRIKIMEWHNFKVSFPTLNYAAVFQSNQLHVTNDAGITWNNLGDFINEDLVFFTDIYFVDNTQGYIVGRNSRIMSTIYEVLPIELTSLTANVFGDKVSLSWSTATETNNKGFEVQRKSGDEAFKFIAYVDGNGNTTEIKSYSFVDKDVTPGVYTYRLKQIDYDGTYSYSSEVQVKFNLSALEFSLENCYPNPFNPTTIIKYTMANEEKVSLIIYDILGREVQTLFSEMRLPGKYSLEFNASELPSGIYFYQLKTGSFTDTKKMILLK